jgi:soluble lytic murein transglycosylase-like protein
MRAQLLAALALLAAGGTAQADVIEISDDGEAHVYGAPAAGNLARVAVSPTGDDGLQGDPFAHAARRHGLDLNLLKAVAWTESRGRNAAVSPKGARGIMQLMPATAAALGVDPRDPNANIHGGAAYLAQQLATFRTVPLALAAYNAGPGAVMRYGGVPPYAETRNYVSTIMRRWAGAGTVLPISTAPFASTVAPAPHGAKRPMSAIALPVMLIEVPIP